MMDDPRSGSAPDRLDPADATPGRDDPAVPAPLGLDLLFHDSKGRVREHPELGTSVADTHAHLDMLDSPALALARAACHHVDFIVCIVDPAENTTAYRCLDGWMDDAQALLERWQTDGTLKVPCVRLMPGVHPHNAKDWDDPLESLLRDLLADERTCGLGEVGLDYHYDFSPRDVQRRVFEREVKIACELDVPLSLHLREAHDEALEILGRTGLPDAGCILHCCNIDADALEPFIGLGCHIAYGGPLTFKKADDVRAAAPLVPLDRLLTETDSPYMTPEPCRGTECGPANTVYTADRLASVYTAAHPELTRADVLDAAYANACRLLGGAGCGLAGMSGRPGEAGVAGEYGR